MWSVRNIGFTRCVPFAQADSKQEMRGQIYNQVLQQVLVHVPCSLINIRRLALQCSILTRLNHTMTSNFSYILPVLDLILRHLHLATRTQTLSSKVLNFFHDGSLTGQPFWSRYSGMTGNAGNQPITCFVYIRVFSRCLRPWIWQLSIISS